MGFFSAELARLQPEEGTERRWVFVPYDQLTDQIGPLSQQPPEELGIILVECPWKASQRPYHKQKLALVLSNLRHFALEQAQRGVAVRHVVSPGPYREALAPLAEELGPLAMMEPAERELRQDLGPLVEAGKLEVRPHEGWLTSRAQFVEAVGEDPPWRLESFYRHIRRESGILMEDGQPVGGEFNYDDQNREFWPGEPAAPEVPRFPVDEVKQEVADLIEERFGSHPGAVDLEQLPATKADAERLWQWALEDCMEHFGPYEDAMSTRSRNIFHTRISMLLNLLRLLPARVVADAERADIPLNSKEGFIRQVLGWREFIYHVHRQTDGLRQKLAWELDELKEPGDGGFAGWNGEEWSRQSPAAAGGAAPRFAEEPRAVPPAWWGEPSGLCCLDRAVEAVWDEAYSHHILRLMVLSNIANLLDVEPRQLTDWFWVAYADAYDWVVEPNVLSMGTFATGPIMSTKPYVSGAPYISRMSNYCGECRFDPDENCPLTRLYWAFLDRHRDFLGQAGRMGLMLSQVRRRSDEKKEADRRVFEAVTTTLDAGGKVEVEEVERALEA